MIRNSLALEHPVPFGTAQNLTLENTNCRSTYYGRLLGWWDVECASDPSLTKDQSEQGPEMRTARSTSSTTTSVASRSSPPRASGGSGACSGPSRRSTSCATRAVSRAVGFAGLATLYVTIPLAIAGAVVLRRRRIPISPLVAPVLVATLSAMLAFGNPRYRAVGRRRDGRPGRGRDRRVPAPA